MVLEVVLYGHPALTTKGEKITQIDDRIRQLASDMLETMVAYEGIGLAAQQVGLPIRMAVVDVRDTKNWYSTLYMNGKKQSLQKHMPMILINAEVEPFGEAETAVEGCLSFPDIRGQIERPYAVRVKAQNLEGQEITFEADGLLARAIQHEQDHLDGVLFIDRMSPDQRREIAPALLSLSQKGRPA